LETTIYQLLHKDSTSKPVILLKTASGERKPWRFKGGAYQGNPEIAGQEEDVYSQFLLILQGVRVSVCRKADDFQQK